MVINVRFTLKHKVEFLLHDVVLPEILEFKNKGLISNFYFTQSWDIENFIVNVKINTTDPLYNSSYFNNLFSGSSALNSFKKLNDCKFYVTVEENQKYIYKFGSLLNFNILSDLFQRSSIDSILFLDSISPHYEYSLRLSYILKRHLLFLKNSFSDNNEIRDFLRHQLNYWIKYAISDSSNFTKENETILFAHFKTSFDSQRENINQLFSYYYLQTAYFEEAWLKSWERSIETCFSELSNEDEFPIINNKFIQDYFSTNYIFESIKSKWYICNFIMHFENNMTGINYRDEPFVYYILLNLFSNHSK